MPFQRLLDASAESNILASSEFQLLADASLQLADNYERDAAFMEDEDGRQIALALSKWRRRRARFFHELSAQAERLEAAADFGT